MAGKGSCPYFPRAARYRDQVVAVFAAREPTPKWALLAAAEAAGVPALICITKYDLARHAEDIHKVVEIYGNLGYPVILSSTVTGKVSRSYRLRCVIGCQPYAGNTQVWAVNRSQRMQAGKSVCRYLGQCRFGLTCPHTHEPGCAVQKALEDGRISDLRYDAAAVRQSLARTSPSIHLIRPI